MLQAFHFENDAVFRGSFLHKLLLNLFFEMIYYVKFEMRFVP